MEIVCITTQTSARNKTLPDFCYLKHCD